ncbi:MAG: aldo/keto reductase [Firmicutes bacterium]|nr:aldo/keto reductase [Bacillota bacterium]
MEKICLGARGLWVTRLLFGTLTMGPLQRNLPAEEGAALLCYAAARGVNFVDTAEIYGTYPHVREALKKYPDLVVCTKSYAYDLEGAKRSVEKAQEGMGRERIDIFLLHEQESEHTLRGHAQALAHYLSLREAGVIGAVGVSTHHVAGVLAAAAWPGLDIVFTIINERGLGIVDGGRADMERAVALARANGLGVLAMKALGGGHLIKRRESALAYALNLHGVDAVAIGMQSEAEIDYNIARFEGRAPGEACARATRDARRSLIVQDWCEGCGACVRRCGQKALALQGGKAVLHAESCVRCGYCAAVCPAFCLKVI